MSTERATFAAGCFWGVEHSFRQLPGVKEVTSGYTGGHKDDPTYEEVCGHSTGHAEAVLVEYDPSVVSYRALVDRFFEIHDPTTINRQGPDVGAQYRSAIFFHSPEQEAVARAAVTEWQGSYARRIVTEVEPASTFWPAEEYHQRYIEKGGEAACHI